MRWGLVKYLIFFVFHCPYKYTQSQQFYQYCGCSCPMDRSLMPVQTVRMVSVKDFEAGAHDSVLNVISLTAGPLKSFTEIWYSVFLWALFSSLFIHIGATLIAFCRLRKHHLGRWIPLAILAMGIISPLTGGVVSSAAIAGVYRASDFIMMPFYALVWGVGQTVVVVVISFSRILATL